MRILFIALLVSIQYAYCQTKVESNSPSNNSIAVSISTERNDFYTTFTCINTQKSFSLNPSVGIGLVHSFFQKNLFIRFGFDAYYNVLDKTLDNSRKVKLGGGLGYHFSFYKRPALTRINETCLGFFLQYGNRLKFIQKIAIGLLRESFNGNSQRVILYYPNFHFSIGLSYEI